MTARVNAITRAVKSHDPSLYCEESNGGMLKVIRKTKAYEAFGFEDHTLLYSRVIPQVIFCLTDNWVATGKPREWGIEPIVNRLQKIDAWNRTNIMRELERQYDQDKESRDRDLKNKNESFLYEHHKSFRKAFSDINTSGFEDPRRKTDGCRK